MLSAAPPRVVVVEDEPLYRELLVGALRSSGCASVLAGVGSFAEALACPELAVCDVALIDIDLGGESGIELSQRLRALHPSLGIVLLSNHAHPVFARSLARSGMSGWGYLLKNSVRDLGTLLRALEAVRRGEVVLGPQLVRSETLPQTGARLGLTPRQQELWALLTQGYSNAAIARVLGLSAKSVENALGLLYAALDINTADQGINPRVAAALRYAVEAQQAHLTLLD